MNNILKLKGTFTQKAHSNTFGPPSLPKNSIVKLERVRKIANDIKEVGLYWSNKQKYVNGIFFSVYYKDIVSKSRRISTLFKTKNIDMNKQIVGARFSPDKKKHIITYYVGKDSIKKTLDDLNAVIEIMKYKFNNGISENDFEKIDKLVDFNKYPIKRTKFLQLIVDINNVEKIKVDENKQNVEEESIVSVYKTEKSAKEIMELLNIDVKNTEILNNTTMYLKKNEIEKINKEAPYLIAMTVIDVSTIPAEVNEKNQQVQKRFIKKN